MKVRAIGGLDLKILFSLDSSHVTKGTTYDWDLLLKDVFNSDYQKHLPLKEAPIEDITNL